MCIICINKLLEIISSSAKFVKALEGLVNVTISMKIHNSNWLQQSSVKSINFKYQIVWNMHGFL